MDRHVEPVVFHEVQELALSAVMTRHMDDSTGTGWKVYMKQVWASNI